VRFTKGVDKGGFFQKHYQKHFPAWLDKVELGSKTRVTYPIVDNAAGLVYMANQGSIDFHIITSRKGSLIKPDEIVFDLDPPEGKFELVRQTARLLGDLLLELGLPRFIKTTGGKGLHIVSPLDRAAGFDEVNGLCGRIAKLLSARHPDIITTEFYKKDRKGRLYFDTGRNVMGATFVTAYSLRGRPNAPVSAPIEWAELDDPAMRPDAFHLRVMRARLDKHGDPWRALRAREGSIAGAAAALRHLEG
jgi:bifunctional non-homologous end joining protein LigD